MHALTFLCYACIFCPVNTQIAQAIAKQTKSRIFSKKTVDESQADLHNTRHLLRGKMERLHSSAG